LNHAEVKPTEAGGNVWQWAVSDVKGIREEPEMPPSDGVVGQNGFVLLSTGRDFTKKTNLANWKTWASGTRIWPRDGSTLPNPSSSK